MRRSRNPREDPRRQSRETRVNLLHLLCAVAVRLKKIMSGHCWRADFAGRAVQSDGTSILDMKFNTRGDLLQLRPVRLFG